MLTKLWETTIDGDTIASGATQWYYSEPMRFNRPPARFVRVQFRITVVTPGGEPIKVTMWGQDSAVWPNTSEFNTSSYEWRGSRIGSTVTVDTDGTVIVGSNKQWVPSRGFRAAVSVENTGIINTTPEIQVEVWVHQE